MVFKLLIVILTLLLLDTSAQRLNRLQIDLYKYGFIKNHDKRQNDNNESEDIEYGTPTKLQCNAQKNCNEPLRKPMVASGITVTDNLKGTTKRAWGMLDLMNLLRSLQREEISEPVIFVPEELEDRLEK